MSAAAPQHPRPDGAIRPMSFVEWAELDDEERGELVDGYLVEAEVPSYVHEVVVGFLIEVLRVWARAHGARVVPSGVKFKVAARRGRMADVSVYLEGAGPPQKYGVVDVPPSIAIEVVSPSPKDERRDRVEKLAEYAAFGVRWYWLVDPELRTFEILELGADGRYAHGPAAMTEVLANVPGCEGLVIDVPALWAEIDALPTQE